MKVRRVILFVGLLLVVAGICVFLNSGFREVPPIFFWGLLLLLFRFLLSRRGLAWKIAAFVVGWFDVLFPFAVITKAVFSSGHYWAVVGWVQLIISAVVSGAAVYYLPFGPITAVSKAEHVPNPTVATAIDSNDK
jgi:hypothetical protein